MSHFPITATIFLTIGAALSLLLIAANLKSKDARAVACAIFTASSCPLGIAIILTHSRPAVFAAIILGLLFPAIMLLLELRYFLKDRTRPQQDDTE